MGSIFGAISASRAAKKAAKKSQEVAKATPVYNAQAEQTKAANQEAEANRRRVMTETDTVQTSALGNTGTTELKKKTLLGG